MKHCPVCLSGFTDEHSTCPTDGAKLVATNTWAVGTLIRAKYRILECIGHGGMGVVYKAEHIALNELRALKVMASQLAGDPSFLRRFHQEARSARAINHPYIVRVDDLEQAEDGSLFIAMEYVAGSSLRSVLRSDEKLHAARAVGLARKIAEGLAAAHAAGMVHRDIKPENILVTMVGGHELPKLVDFGIVALRESTNTLSSRPIMTPQYAAPEQWRGLPASDLDGRTDLYALGMTLFEMLTGVHPFEAKTAEEWMYAHLAQPPLLPSAIVPALAEIPSLDALVLRLIEKERRNRPATARETAEELTAIEGDISSRKAWTGERSTGVIVTTPPKAARRISDPATGAGERKATPPRGVLEAGAFAGGAVAEERQAAADRTPSGRWNFASSAHSAAFESDRQERREGTAVHERWRFRAERLAIQLRAKVGDAVERMRLLAREASNLPRPVMVAAVAVIVFVAGWGIARLFEPGRNYGPAPASAGAAVRPAVPNNNRTVTEVPTANRASASPATGRVSAKTNTSAMDHRAARSARPAKDRTSAEEDRRASQADIIVGDMYLERGNYTAAKEAYHRAIAENPSNRVARLRLEKARRAEKAERELVPD